MGKTPSQSRTELVQIVMPQYCNGSNRLFGGELMKWIDVAAAVAARRHAGAQVTTAAVDHLQFRHPAFLNDSVLLVATVTYTGRASMEVRVDTFTESLNGNREMINRAYLVMVAVDEKQKSLPVPELIPETEEEKKEWEAGKLRYLERKERNKKERETE